MVIFVSMRGWNIRTGISTYRRSSMKFLENANINSMEFELNPIVGILYMYLVPILFIYALLMFFAS
jgi:hypothetical protein